MQLLMNPSSHALPNEPQAIDAVHRSAARIGVVALLLIFVVGLMPSRVTAQSSEASDVAIVIHGGAGTIARSAMTDEQDAAYREALRDALQAGHDVLTAGGSAVDAVEAAIVIMEDSPLFNAAKGAVFTSEGTVELDASIMEGRTKMAGALTGVTTIKNPIRLARTIMEESVHVMMAQEGAETFAAQHDLETVPNDYFYTERRRRALERVQEREAEEETDSTGDASPGDAPGDDSPGASSGSHKFGTVGVVALDQNGTLAAGTSTGGTTNKRFGRVGDSPIIGAGTYADNETCGVSATGHGEYFIRAAVAHNIAARMKHGGQSVREASEAVIMDVLPAMSPDGGAGGVIAMDAEGNIAMPFNTEGMYRGYINTEGNRVVRLYGDE
jgi:beta-aspartyl-peptidase (threonine type)